MLRADTPGTRGGGVEGRGRPIEEDGAKERRSTYPCFHTGGTSDARYGASRPAPYTPMRRVNCPARYRAARRGTLYARERRIVYTVVPYRWSYCSPRRCPYAACCISMRETVPPSPSVDVDLPPPSFFSSLIFHSSSSFFPIRRSPSLAPCPRFHFVPYVRGHELKREKKEEYFKVKSIPRRATATW